MTKKLAGALLMWLLGSAAALAQPTGGAIGGRVLDPQGVAVPGAGVTARSPETGFARSDTTDAEGLYRVLALPPGTYEVKVELQGFGTVVDEAVQVYVSGTTTVDFRLKTVTVAETVNVVGTQTLIDTSSSAVAGVVDPERVQRLPLNGRQFANLAATVPGVGLGFHSDPTKGTNYAPFINGGAGRNVNYQVDGADNNDDTVGGLLQQFPLEAIQEFSFQTQRFRAEEGRSNGGVMNVVTKSGTNVFAGSFFELFRNKSLNAVTQTERLVGLSAGRDPVKGDYQRNQFGGSFGGPVLHDRVHFFGAIERTQQDTTQAMGVGTRALFSGLDGAYPIRYRETLGSGKIAFNQGSSHYISVRYGRNKNSFPSGASPTQTPDNWGDANNRFNSINVNHRWVLGNSKLNELIFQYADFANRIASRTASPYLMFPNTVQTGGSPSAPQSTDQRKYQFRDDLSWHVSGHGGLGHDFKAGVSVIMEPRLRITNTAGKGVLQHFMLNNDANGAVRIITLNDGDAHANIPNEQYGLYVQDDWRPSDRLTLNLGVRYDLVTGLAFDQSLNPNFLRVQAAAKAGLLNGIVGVENFHLDSRSDRNNIQPRVGAVYDVRDNGEDIVRGGWGIYTDFGYTNSNVLVAALDASGTRFGPVFTAVSTTGLRNPDGSFYRVGQPIGNLAAQNVAGAAQVLGQWVDPRLQQPSQFQTNIGWSHKLTSNTVVSVDFVNALGRDLNYKPRLNQFIAGTRVRRISSRLSSPLSPDTSGNRPALSRGKSQYNALIVSGQRRLSNGIDFTASYTLSRALSTIGIASDELNIANVQDPNNPFDDPRQLGPNRTSDARHRVNFTGIIELPYSFQLASIFLYRSALPVTLFDARDLNGDGDVNSDIPSVAYAVESVDRATGRATIKSIGSCATVNCGRSSPQSQLNLRVSRSFRLRGRAHVDAIAEMYNVFNALNPLSAHGRVTLSTGLPDPALLQPTSFAGDFQRPEQRVGQVGFRFSF